MITLLTQSLKDYVSKIVNSTPAGKIAAEEKGEDVIMTSFAVSPGSKDTYNSPVSEKGLPLYGPGLSVNLGPEDLEEYNNVDIYAPETYSIESLVESLEDEPYIAHTPYRYAGISDGIEKLFNEEVTKYNEKVKDEHKFSFPKNFKIRPLLLAALQNINTRTQDKEDAVQDFFVKFFSPNKVKTSTLSIESLSQYNKESSTGKLYPKRIILQGPAQEDLKNEFNLTVTKVSDNFIVVSDSDGEEFTIDITGGVPINQGGKTVYPYRMMGKKIKAVFTHKRVIKNKIPAEFLKEEFKEDPESAETLNILSILRSLGDGSFPAPMIRKCIQNSTIDTFRKKGVIAKHEGISLFSTKEEAFNLMLSMEDPENKLALENLINRVFKDTEESAEFKEILIDYIEDEGSQPEVQGEASGLSNLVELQTALITLPEKMAKGEVNVRVKTTGNSTTIPISEGQKYITVDLPTVTPTGEKISPTKDLEVISGEEVLNGVVIKPKNVFKVQLQENADPVEAFVSGEATKSLEKSFPEFAEAMRTFYRNLEKWRFDPTRELDDLYNVTARILARASIRMFLFGYNNAYQSSRNKRNIDLKEFRSAVDYMAEELIEGQTITSDSANPEEARKKLLIAAKAKILENPKTLFSKLGAKFNVALMYRYLSTYMETLVSVKQPNLLVSKKDLVAIAEETKIREDLDEQEALGKEYMEKGFFTLGRKTPLTEISSNAKSIAQKNSAKFLSSVIKLLVEAFSHHPKVFSTVKEYFLSSWEGGTERLELKRIIGKGDTSRITSLAMGNTETYYNYIQPLKVNPSDVSRAQKMSLIEAYRDNPENTDSISILMQDLSGNKKVENQILSLKEKTLCVKISPDYLTTEDPSTPEGRWKNSAEITVKYEDGEEETKKFNLVSGQTNYFITLDRKASEVRESKVLLSYWGNELPHDLIKEAFPVDDIERRIPLIDTISPLALDEKPSLNLLLGEPSELQRLYVEVIQEMWEENYKKTSYYYNLKEKIMKTEKDPKLEENVRNIKLTELRKLQEDPYKVINDKITATKDPEEKKRLIKERTDLQSEISFDVLSYEDFSKEIYKAFAKRGKSLKLDGEKTNLSERLGLQGTTPVPLLDDPNRAAEAKEELDDLVLSINDLFSKLFIEAILDNSLREANVAALSEKTNAEPVRSDAGKTKKPVKKVEKPEEGEDAVSTEEEASKVDKTLDADSGEGQAEALADISLLSDEEDWGQDEDEF